MNVRKKVRQLPLRLTAGGYILNSGLSKWNADETTAKELQAFAAGSYPFLAKLDPQLFVKVLSATEIAVGTVVFLPFVPSLVAGAALTTFSGALLGLYLGIPGMREEGSLRPTQQGIPLAKDIWLAGIGASLLIDGLAR
ncbi:MAG TPA: DoxX family membrane protein [Pseudonocardiaceae bacterium]|nr:DoxX family membrane protein [Pseudonocardiaceae bacterium]